ncbi:hypothetical protein COCON_G00166040 [Conger conger]|uniref:Uncharacterized protein n=1 Tax=Conger conger TaxID=82655 RepID=A0A9Q1D722_CONCO|nr:hypothetical protein COCON_G00166040 [Conger conger]
MLPIHSRDKGATVSLEGHRTALLSAAVGLQVAIAASVSAVSEDVSRDDSDGVSAESVSELQKRDSDSKSVEDGHESDSDSVEDGDEADSEAKNVEDGDGMMGTQGTPSPTVQ